MNQNDELLQEIQMIQKMVHPVDKYDISLKSFIDTMCDTKLTGENLSGIAESIERRLAELHEPIVANTMDEKKRFVGELECWATAKIWEKEKQIFRFDKDFTEALADTDKLCFTENMLDFLPCQAFVLDISENQEMCKQFQCEYMMILPLKKKDGLEYEANILCFGKEEIEEAEKFYWHSMTLFLKNNNQEIDSNEMDYDLNQGCENLRDSKGRLNGYNPEVQKKLNNFIFQALTYLSSVEPDIKETQKSENANKIYRRTKKGEKPERVHEVGIRYGMAYRKWMEVQKEHESTGTGEAKMPHLRRAHWHRYWYNVVNAKNEIQYDENHNPLKELRQKWLHQILVNVEKEEDQEKMPAVVRKQKKPKSVDRC